MTDTLPTVWKAQPHTLAKHAILERYLQAWLPILAHQSATIGRKYQNSQTREILYIDGFAGPGEYEGGEPGSPVIALRAALQHAHSFPVPVRMLFIERREDRYKRLCQIVQPHIEQSGHSQNVHAAQPLEGDCDEVLGEILKQYISSGEIGDHFRGTRETIP